MDILHGYSRITWGEVLHGSGVSHPHELPADIRHNLVSLAEAFRVVRDLTGMAIRICSGYRSPAVNEACGGAPGSQHLQGRALDIRLVGRTATVLQPEMRALYRLIDRAQQNGRIHPGGLAVYAGRDPETGRRDTDWVDFLHFDTRGWRARWNSADRQRLLG